MPWLIPKIETPEKPKAPSRGRLAGMGLMIFPLGSLTTLLLWPRGQSTATPWFWVCMFVFPALVWAGISGLRWHFYERRLVRAEMWEAEAERTMNDWGKWARAHLPLRSAWALLPVSAKPLSASAAGLIELASLTGPLDGRPYNLGKTLQLDLGAARDLEDRFQEAAGRLINHLVEELSGSDWSEVQNSRPVVEEDDDESEAQPAKPSGRPAGPSGLRVLVLSHDPELAARVWPLAWDMFDWSAWKVTISYGRLADRPDLSEEWYDQELKTAVFLAVLNFSGQGSETAAAFWFGPGGKEGKTSGSARPNPGSLDEAEESLGQMIEFKQAGAKAVKGLWRVGLDNRSGAVVLAAAQRRGLALANDDLSGEYCLEVMLGPLGEGGFWLAWALAAMEAKRSGAAQLLAAGTESGLDLRLVNPKIKDLTTGG